MQGGKCNRHECLLISKFICDKTSNEHDGENWGCLCDRRENSNKYRVADCYMFMCLTKTVSNECITKMVSKDQPPTDEIRLYLDLSIKDGSTHAGTSEKHIAA